MCSAHMVVVSSLPMILSVDFVCFLFNFNLFFVFLYFFVTCLNKNYLDPLVF
jgi:hypothetical protein